MLSKIPNHIGEYICQLCFSWFPDAFSLAEHPCSCMANLSYPCEICGKVFNCPANLASHQRWHRPRITNHKSTNKNENNSQINKQKIHNRNKSVTTSYNYHVDSLLKQNSTSSESDRQNTLAYSEHINHMFRTSKNYRVSHEEKMNDKMTEEQQLYNEPGVKSIISNGYKVIGMNTNKTVHTPTTSNSVSSFSATCTNKQIDPFSVEALLA
ncbi:unnamed protein product [Heterobilharzia americana]|nr:unnamed protein product [Heterobilharzia americana]